MIGQVKNLRLLAYFIACFLGCTSFSYANTALNNFIGEVLENNPAIQAAKSNVLAAKARGRASNNALYNPELTAETQRALENTSSIGISQTIDWTNKRGARGQAGAANARIAQAELAQLRQQLATQVLSALAKYHAGQQALNLAKERTSLLKQFVELTRKRYSSGDVARIDLDLAQLALSEALALQADTEVNANQALQTLRAISGVNQMHWPQMPSTLPSPVSSKTDTDHYVYNLPSLAIFENQSQSARARLKLAERQRYPDPTIGIQGGESSGEGERKRLYGLTLTIPLFALNSYKAEADAANYDAAEADAKRVDTIRQAKAEIRSSAERYQILYRASLQWQQAAGKPLSDGMTLIERLWQAGEINSTDYIVQLKQRIDSQISGVELKGRAWQAWAEWLKASGQIDKWLQLKPLNSGETLCS